jgi:hypothetical protein
MSGYATPKGEHISSLVFFRELKSIGARLLVNYVRRRS